jgi:hypothetical protein
MSDSFSLSLSHARSENGGFFGRYPETKGTFFYRNNNKTNKRRFRKLAKNICGIIFGEGRSAEEAGRLVETMKNCPYVVASGTTSNKIYSVYIVPEEKKWWLKYPETNPEATGLEKARVFIVENISYPEKFNWKLPKKKTKMAPCGAYCQACALHEEYDCSGCPATVHYKGK